MFTDKYGQIILSEDDICDLYMSKPERTFKKIITDSDIAIHDLGIDYPNIIKHKESDLNIEAFDQTYQQSWYMPDEYKSLDIAKWVLEQCKNEAELQRAGQELLLYQELELFDLLRYLKYLVDTMRANNIIWGVGRGSSVSSFVLYLIGIHKINSLYYDLPIEEFLK